MQILYVPGLTSSNIDHANSTKEYGLGYIRHQAYQSHGRFPVRNTVAQRLEKEELTKALEE